MVNYFIDLALNCITPLSFKGFYPTPLDYMKWFFPIHVQITSLIFFFCQDGSNSYNQPRKDTENDTESKDDATNGRGNLM